MTGAIERDTRRMAAVGDGAVTGSIERDTRRMAAVGTAR
jgi:hypothetical protein